MKKEEKKFIDIPKDEYFKKITKYQWDCPFERTLSCQSVIRKIHLMVTLILLHQ